ncbi:nuclear transport factor 2 family protein [Gemmatimonadota bacterium]
MTAESWIEDLLTSIDEMNAEKFMSFLTDDSIFRYGSNREIVGESAIKEHVAQFFGMFKALHHKLIGSWAHPDAVFVQGEVRYTTHDGSEISLPFLNCFKMRDDKIQEYLIYIDPTPLAG